MKEPKICPICGGYGSIEVEEPIGYVTLEMAIDGGDRNLEGQVVYGMVEVQCDSCGGSGIINETNEQAETKNDENQLELGKNGCLSAWDV